MPKLNLYLSALALAQTTHAATAFEQAQTALAEFETQKLDAADWQDWSTMVAQQRSTMHSLSTQPTASEIAAAAAAKAKAAAAAATPTTTAPATASGPAAVTGAS